MVKHEELVDGSTVWYAWAGPSYSHHSSSPASALCERLEVVSGADRLVRRAGGALKVLAPYEMVFASEQAAKSHIVATIEQLAASVRSVADSFR